MVFLYQFAYWWARSLDNILLLSVTEESGTYSGDLEREVATDGSYGRCTRHGVDCELSDSHVVWRTDQGLEQ